MQFSSLAARMEFLAWRDGQFAAISDQLSDAFPGLLARLSDIADAAPTLDLVTPGAALKRSVAEALTAWGAEQLGIANTRASTTLEQYMNELPGDLALDPTVWSQVASAAPAVAGLSLIAASIAAIPTVVSFATVSTSVLAFWATATISWPLFAAGAVVIGVASLLGAGVLDRSQTWARDRLRAALHSEAERQVFGLHGPIGARCVLSDIQAAILAAGEKRMTGADA
ncbi:hypothetical protein V8J36_09820 [Frigidibacter sp. MR17.14]|uniref:hypothetical protein n=1 Tax=Frigidibacter sp. MR17.14 TaxID=3126509 RepID=UPI0030131806